MTENFKLESQDATPERLLIDKVEEVNNLEELAQLAFDNPDTIGEYYFPLRYAHLDASDPELMKKYSGCSKKGYLLDAAGNETDTHITQIDDFHTDNDFYPKVKSMVEAALTPDIDVGE